MQAMTTQDKNGKNLYFLEGKRVSFIRYHLMTFLREKDCFVTIERNGKFYYYHTIRGV